MYYKRDNQNIRQTQTGDLRIRSAVSSALFNHTHHTKFALMDSLLDYADEHTAWEYDEVSFKHIQKILRKYKPLTSEAEITLFEKVKAGDENAYNKFVLSNLRFVLSVARKHQNLGLPLNDLISEGIIGLCKAVKSWDESRGLRFITYAYHYIRAEILNSLRYSSLIRIPSNVLGTINSVKRKQEENVLKYGHGLNVFELSERLEIPVDKVALALKVASCKILPFECIQDVTDTIDDFDATLTALTEGPIYTEYPIDEEMYYESLPIIVHCYLHEKVECRISLERLARKNLREANQKSHKTKFKKAIHELNRAQKQFLKDFKKDLRLEDQNFKKYYEAECFKAQYLVSQDNVDLRKKGDRLLAELNEKLKKFEQYQRESQEYRNEQRRRKAKMRLAARNFKKLHEVEYLKVQYLMHQDDHESREKGEILLAELNEKFETFGQHQRESPEYRIEQRREKAELLQAIRDFKKLHEVEYLKAQYLMRQDNPLMQKKGKILLHKLQKKKDRSQNDLLKNMIDQRKRRELEEAQKEEEKRKEIEHKKIVEANFKKLQEERRNRESELERRRQEEIKQNILQVCNSYINEEIDAKQHTDSFNEEGLFEYIKHKDPHGPSSKLKYLHDSTISMLRGPVVKNILSKMDCNTDVFQLRDVQPIDHILSNASELFEGNPNAKYIVKAIKLFRAYMDFAKSSQD